VGSGHKRIDPKTAEMGFKMANHMRAELCAFTAGVKKYQAYGMIFHSDRRSQYTSGFYRQTLAQWCNTKYEQPREML